MPKRLPTPVLDHWEWQMRAACQGMDASVFFAPSGERGRSRRLREERARQICLVCPVKEPCAVFAAELNERHGVWGGRSERERAAQPSWSWHDPEPDFVAAPITVINPALPRRSPNAAQQSGSQDTLAQEPG